MKINKIKFIANKEYLNILNKEEYPSPIKINVPEWFKNLKHDYEKKTVKGCIPFLETLTTGYLLKLPQDFAIKHNVLNNEGKKDSFFNFGLHNHSVELKRLNVNLNSSFSENHPTFQLEGSPYVEKNKNLPFYKILNPWIIKTPPGFSCLFLPPLNNTDDRFSIIPAIVNTDTYKNEINFPIVLNGDKYNVLDTILKRGTPYVQIIPFERKNWEMSVETIDSVKKMTNSISFFLDCVNVYKNKIWDKTSWR
jgi:hypothetical protein